MAAIFMDGFDHYGTGSSSTANLLAGPYASIGNAECGVPTWGPARTGLACLQQSSGAAEQSFTARRVLPTPGTSFFVSFGWSVDQIIANTTPYIVGFMDGSQNVIVQLGYTSTGALYLAKADGTVLGITDGPVVVAQNWHFFEMGVDTFANTFTLRVDDAQGSNTPILSIHDAGNITGTIAQFGLLSGNSGPTAPPNSHIDDLFVRDSSGSVNNGFLGDRRVATLFANEDTTTSGWTPSYYQEFGAGILRLSNIIAGTNTVQSPNALLQTASSGSLDIGAADFTIESFVRFDAVPGSNYSSIISRWDTTANHRSYRLILGSTAFNGGCLQFDTSTDGSASTVVTKVQFPWVPDINVWYHLAIVRAAGELLLFVDGQQFGLPIADTDTYFSGGTEVLNVGIETQGGTNPTIVSSTNFIGRMDETRFTNGVGRYTGPFSPPVAAFPRGTSDPDWSQVVLLMGYDSAVVDESSFGRTVLTNNGAISFIPSDGPAVGVYSTVNKAVPDDNTFISADLTNATNILTLATQPSASDTVTVGTKDGTTAAVYTFKTSVSSAFDVLIDTTAQNTLINLLNAINAGTGSGTKYGTGTTSNFDVNAVQLPVGQIQVIANTAGTGGNSIASTSTGTHAAWATSTLTGGASIPGPTEFKVQRPPNNTTLISAVQMNVRALKSDAGTATIRSTFIGALGGTDAGPTHNLTISPSYYGDIFEIDPDTMGNITPTTIVNGKIEINRTA